MSKLSACVNVGVHDLNGNCLRIVGAVAVHKNLDGNGGKALCLSCNGAHSIYFDDGLVAGLKLYRGILGEVGIQRVVQKNRLGGIHLQVVVTLEEVVAADISQELILILDHIV